MVSVPQSYGILSDEVTYSLNEVVVGSESSATARVRSYDANNFLLSVSNITGTFSVGENIVGVGGSYLNLLSTDYIDIEPYSSSRDIQTEADSILDFTETNPFGGV